MYCKKCGNKVNDGDVFCQSCGAEIENPEEAAASLKGENKQDSSSGSGQVSKSQEILKYLENTSKSMGLFLSLFILLEAYVVLQNIVVIFTYLTSLYLYRSSYFVITLCYSLAMGILGVVIIYGIIKKNSMFYRLVEYQVIIMVICTFVIYLLMTRNILLAIYYALMYSVVLVAFMILLYQSPKVKTYMGNDEYLKGSLTRVVEKSIKKRS